MSLQTDDGRLKCLAHPGERWSCERHGLTLGQASQRGRLYRETFFVCRNCGREGETIRPQVGDDSPPYTFPVRSAVTWCWSAAALVVPLFAWLQWWEGVVIFGGTLVGMPVYFWWEGRKDSPAARGFPHPDAPGRHPIAAPTAGCSDETVVGWVVGSDAFGCPRATGPCCDRPNWVPASQVKGEDRVPCPVCEGGVMVVSEHSIH